MISDRVVFRPLTETCCRPRESGAVRERAVTENTCFLGVAESPNNKREGKTDTLASELAASFEQTTNV